MRAICTIIAGHVLHYNIMITEQCRGGGEGESKREQEREIKYKQERDRVGAESDIVIQGS